MQLKISQDGGALTVRVPLTFRRRGGRKLVLAPDGSDAWVPRRAHINSAMIKALARSHRWMRMLESGEFTTVAEVAAAEKINSTYVSRILRLSLLAPDIVSAILEGRQPADLQLDQLIRPFPGAWREQRTHFRLC